MKEIKLCECGCGNPAPIAKKTSTRNGHIKGRAVRFIYNHHLALHKIGEKNPNWKGGRTQDTRGYMFILSPDHPQANKFGYVRQHRIRAEKAIGRILPLKHPVHHHSKNELVVCENHAYHRLLHLRTWAYRACGHAGFRKCPYCKKYDSVEKMILRRSGDRIQYAHAECKRIYERKRRKTWRGLSPEVH